MGVLSRQKGGRGKNCRARVRFRCAMLCQVDKGTYHKVAFSIS